MTREGIAFKPLAVYILKPKVQKERVKVMVQRREMNKTAITSQKIGHEPQVFKVVWVVAIFVTHAGEIWGNLICLPVGSTYTLAMYAGELR